jgi:hypothetical protein
MMSSTAVKKSKHSFYHDPTAFSQRFPRIDEVTDGSLWTPMMEHAPGAVRTYRMGNLKIILKEPDKNGGWHLSVHGPGRYPSWDELVWLRYNLIPDAALMALLLPNLDAYINHEDTQHKNVFTMEQKGWVLNPTPDHCEQAMTPVDGSVTPTTVTFACAACGATEVVEFATWNEQHGNGLHGGE